MTEPIKILCVDDEPNVLKALRRLLRDELDYEILLAESGEAGLKVMEQQQEEDVRLIISDYRMPGMSGVEFLGQVYEKWPDTIRIVLSGYADTAAIVEAINLGQIYKFIGKPWDDEELKTSITQALQHQELRSQNILLNRELQKKNRQLEEINTNLEHLVEERTAALELRNRVLQVAQGVLDVLPLPILGIDNEGIIVQCNDQAISLFPADGTGPLGNYSQEVLPVELSQFLDRQIKDVCPLHEPVSIQGKVYRAEVRRLDENMMQGTVLVLVPQSGC